MVVKASAPASPSPVNMVCLSECITKSFDSIGPSGWCRRGDSKDVLSNGRGPVFPVEGFEENNRVEMSAALKQKSVSSHGLCETCPVKPANAGKSKRVQ